MLAGNFGGLGAAWVNHYNLTAAFTHGRKAFGDVGHGHHAAVGRNRIATENKKIIGVINIGNCDHELMPEHQQRCQLLRQLVDRGCTKRVFCFERAHQRRHTKQGADIVNRGIARIKADGIVAMFCIYSG